MEFRSALLALLLAVSLSLADAAVPANSCPTTCSTTAGLITFDPNLADDTTDTAASATACGVECRGKNYAFYQFETGAPNTCRCYSACGTLQETAVAVTIGASASCGIAVFTPVCPTTCTSVSSGTFGWSPNDASHGPRYLGVSNAATCAQQCRGVNAGYFQYSSTTNLANGFTPSTCDCFYSCPTFTNFSPIVFTIGQTCKCDTATCLAPPSAQVTLACATGKRDNGNSKYYDCQLCNTAPAAAPNTLPKILNNVQLACNSFNPVEPAPCITPACTVLATLYPGQCKTFTYRNPNTLGAATFTVPANPFITSSVTLTSLAPLSLGPCILRTSVSQPQVYITYECKIVNNGLTPARNIILNCAGFNPTSVSGINPDCSISKTVFPGESCPFSFTTLPAEVTLAVQSFSP